MAEDLLLALGQIMQDQPTDEVITCLIILSARALVCEAQSIDDLSTRLLKFCRIVQNEAADMFQGAKPHAP